MASSSSSFSSRRSIFALAARFMSASPAARSQPLASARAEHLRGHLIRPTGKVVLGCPLLCPGKPPLAARSHVPCATLPAHAGDGSQVRRVTPPPGPHTAPPPAYTPPYP